MGRTLHLEVQEDIYASLVETARRRGQSHEAVAVEWLGAATQAFALDSLEKYIGAFSSKCSEWADQHDKYIGISAMSTVHGLKGEGNSGA